MAKKKNYDNEDGVWRTVGGRRIFIRNGQDLASAMKDSGKFNKGRKELKKYKLDGKEINESDIKNEYEKERKSGNIDKDMSYDDYKSGIVDDKNSNVKSWRDKLNTEEGRKEIFDKELDKSTRDKMYDYYKNESDVSKMSNEELTNSLNKQSELYNQNTGNKKELESSMKKLNEEMEKRNMPRYNIYDESNNMLMVSSPTKEMADRQLSEMYETDKSLQKSYGWKKLPKYRVSEEIKEDNRVDRASLSNDNEGLEKEGRRAKREYNKKLKEDDRISKGMTKEEYKQGKYVFEREKEDYEDILNRYSEDYGYEGKDRLSNLKGQIDYMRNPGESINQTAQRLVSGGDFLIYNGDVQDYLKQRGIKFNEDNFFDKYKTDMAGKIEKLYNQADLKDRYSGTVSYLQKTTNMSSLQILELLKKIDEDKK